MIYLPVLRGLNEEDIINLLLEQKKQPFEIRIPKSTQECFSEPLAIARDYAAWAYAGQLLHDIADSFDYVEIPPALHESTSFEITVRDIEKLADTLLYISYDEFNEHEDEDFIYADDLYDYIDRVKGGEIKPACAYFIEVSNQFVKQEEEELE